MQTLTRTILGSAAPALYLFILPFAHTTSVRSIAFALMLAGAMVAWRAERPALPPLLWPFALWATVALLALPWASDTRFSLSEIKSEIAYGLLAYLVFFALTRDATDIRRYVMVIGAAVALLCAHASWTFARTGSIEGDNLHGGVLYFIAFLATVIPVLLGAAVAQGVARWMRNAAAGLIILALCTGALGLNRSFVPTVALSVALFALLYFSRVAVDRRVKLRAGLAAVLVVPVLLSGFLWIAQHRARPQLSLAQAVEHTVTADPRFKIWAYSVTWIADHPWTGTGFGRMAQVDKFRKALNDDTAVHPHNILLSQGVQTGIPGMIALTVLFVAVVRRLLALYRDDDPALRLIGITGLSVVCAVLLKNMVDDLFVRHNAWLFWALLGMAFGYAERRRAQVR